MSTSYNGARYQNLICPKGSSIDGETAPPRGETILYRAVRHLKEWQLSSKLKNDEFWNRHDPISLEDLQRLRETVWRKYQRKRIAWEQVSSLDALIEEEEERLAEVQKKLKETPES